MAQYEIEIKKAPPLRVMGARDVIPTYPHVGSLFEEVVRHLQAHDEKPAGPGLAIYYDMAPKERDHDVEAAVPVGECSPDAGRVKCHTLPGYETMAAVVHEGPYEGIGAAYDALITWVRSNGYEFIGPNREVYLRGNAGSSLAYGQDDVAEDPADLLTEIQFPVRKAAYASIGRTHPARIPITNTGLHRPQEV